MNKEDKEELLKEIDERLKQLRKEFIASLDDKKEFKLTYPEEDEVVYCISNGNASIYDIYFDPADYGDIKAFEHGLYFDIEQEAEQYLRECKLLFKLKQWAKIKNDGWEPRWRHGAKYYKIVIDKYQKIIQVRYYTIFDTVSKLPHFKSEEIAQECIDLFGDEIIEVLC